MAVTRASEGFPVEGDALDDRMNCASRCQPEAFDGFTSHTGNEPFAAAIERDIDA